MSRIIKSDSRQLSLDFEVRPAYINLQNFNSNVLQFLPHLEAKVSTHQNKIVDRLLIEARKIKW